MKPASISLEQPSLARRYLSWKPLFAYWTIFSVLKVVPAWIAFAVDGRAFPFDRILASNLIHGLLWAAATPVILLVSRRFPIRPPNLGRNVALHFAVSTCLTLLALAALSAIKSLTFVPGPAERDFARGFLQLFGGYFSFTFLYYWIVVFAHQMLTYLDLARSGQRAAALLKERLAEARLGELRSRLRPHFLFNTLHTIGSLVRLERKDEAVHTIVEFGDLMRFSLHHSERDLVPLSQELAFVRKYLSIERMRFSDRLHVVYDVDPSALGAQVPSLVLQPLVENAVRHGIGRARSGSEIRVVARRLDGDVLLSVADDGAGADGPIDPARSLGVGLRCTHDRLRALYPGRFRFTVDARAPRGTVATVSFPWSEAASS